MGKLYGKTEKTRQYLEYWLESAPRGSSLLTEKGIYTITKNGFNFRRYKIHGIRPRFSVRDEIVHGH